MLPFLIPTAIRSIPWRLIAVAVVALALISAGIWFRGVLAENKELSQVVKAQTETLKEVNAEVERMNRQDALDYNLRQMIEVEKAQLSADLKTQQRNLKKAKELLDEASTRCLDLPLPQSYLDGLPQAGDKVRP